MTAATQDQFSPLQELRQACHSSHEALHVHPLLAPLTQESIALSDYRWIIQAFDAAYNQMEAVRHFIPSDLPDAPGLEWLECDMAFHGISPREVAPVYYPDIDTYSRLAGYLYVKQGSTLGGRVISKHLTRHLGLVDGVSNHFFAGYGEETGPQWKRFTRELEGSGDVLVMDEVVEQALASFRMIEICANKLLEQKRAC